MTDDRLLAMMNELEQDVNKHLSKFEKWWHLELVLKSLDLYFNRYCEEHWLAFEDEEEKNEAKKKFKNEKLIPDVKEYYYLVRNDWWWEEFQRMKYLWFKYKELIYDWEDLPYEDDDKLENYNEWTSFAEFAVVFWQTETTKWDLIDNLQ